MIDASGATAGLTLLNGPITSLIRASVTATGTNFADHLRGGAGDDHLSAGWGTDLLDGGNGNDTFILRYFDSQNGHDSIYAGAGNDLVTSVYEVTRNLAAATNHIIWTGAGEDTVYAGIGADLIGGGDGFDLIYGDDSTESAQDGNDTIYAGNGSDTVYGMGGDDEIWGGSDYSDDSLNGGTGNDLIGGGKWC
ncbi:MAG: calcium-binding protein [Thalassovita sp.]